MNTRRKNIIETNERKGIRNWPIYKTLFIYFIFGLAWIFVDTVFFKSTIDQSVHTVGGIAVGVILTYALENTQID